jgi:hypothetical protein
MPSLPHPGMRASQDQPFRSTSPQRKSPRFEGIDGGVRGPTRARLKAGGFAPAELLAAQPVVQRQFPQWICLLAGENTACHDGRPWAYALDIAAWAFCQACTTSAGSRPRSLTL